METRTVTLTLQVETDVGVETTVLRMVPVSFQMIQHRSAVQIGAECIQARGSYLVLHGEVFPSEEKVSVSGLPEDIEVRHESLVSWLQALVNAKKAGHPVEDGSDPRRRNLLFWDRKENMSHAIGLTTVRGGFAGNGMTLAGAFGLTVEGLNQKLLTPEGRAELCKPDPSVIG